nr:MAG TPA: hypothetical protein [Crassvirales sp.]
MYNIYNLLLPFFSISFGKQTQRYLFSPYFNHTCDEIIKIALVSPDFSSLVFNANNTCKYDIEICLKFSRNDLKYNYVCLSLHRLIPIYKKK